MSRYDTYQANAVEAPVLRKWIVVALIVSLLLHAGLFVFFKLKKLENFRPPAERLAPTRVFSMKKWNIPEIPKEEVHLKTEKIPTPVNIPVPQDKPEVQEYRLTPQTPDLPQPLVAEKPRADVGGSDVLSKIEAESRGAMDKELSTLAGSLIKEGPRSRRQPVLNLPASNKPGDGRGDAEGIPGTQSIDAALARTGPLPVGDKPIGMPGGALYEYDKADLKPDAIELLQKLGELFRRYPKSTFSIEGHTDSFGSTDYNQKLSERRADAVKVWLVTKMGVAPERIEIKGFGNTKWIVPPGRSIEEQAPNRRVEIVIKTNRK